jgi:hypothetical protein
MNRIHLLNTTQPLYHDLQDYRMNRIHP